MRRLLTFTLLCALALPCAAQARAVEPRIVGGDIVQQDHYPWQVAMLSSGGSQYCGGTLVAKEWVLTADHCWPLLTEHARVKSIYRSSGGEVYDIAEVVRHPQADGREDPVGHQPTYRYDVNLVRLSAPVTDARPLVVAGPADDAWWAAGDLLTITGWGHTSEGGLSSSTMREAQVPRVADASCTAVYGADFEAGNMLCAGYVEGGVDTCQGDSGGPIIAPTVASPSKRNPAHWRLVGVTSWGAGCAVAGYPGVYARIADPVIRDWIIATIPAEDPVDTTLIDAEQEAAERQEEVPAELPPVTLLPVPEPAPAAAPPVQVAPPAPVQTAPPAAAPVGLDVTRRCTRKRRCSFTITPSGEVAKLRARMSSTTRRVCRRRGRRTTCAKVTVRTLTARRRGEAFQTSAAPLGKGTHSLTVTPLDASGKRAGAPKRYRFSLR